MLQTKQNVLRKFWYSTVATESLKDGPKPFTLMGQNIVLFLDAEGKPVALEDRCCHRTSRLSKGYTSGGDIICGYHGWQYNSRGKLVKIPQFPPEQPIPDAGVKPFFAEDRYGYVWVALDEPIAPIPDVPEERDPNYRRIHQFYDKWNTSALRLMENSFDNAHFSSFTKARLATRRSQSPRNMKSRKRTTALKLRRSFGSSILRMPCA